MLTYGNMETCVITGTGTYTLTHNANNRLVTVEGDVTAGSYYALNNAPNTIEIYWKASSGAGQNNGVLTLWINGVQKYTKTNVDNDTHRLGYVAFLFQDTTGISGSFLVDAFESWTGSETAAVTKYYYAGSTRVAMNENGTLLFLLSDHLGSSSVTYNPATLEAKYQKYLPYGEVRGGGVNGLETEYTFTGQYSYADSFGLAYFNARWYDSSLGRFTSPDTIIPEAAQGNQAWDRYAYVNNNPVTMIDPSGHWGFNFSFNLQSAVTSALNSVGLTNNAVSTILDKASTVLDKAAMAIDGLIAVGDITSAAIGATSGAGFSLPEGGAPVVVTGPAGVALGMGQYELHPAIRMALFAGNALATVSTLATGISDVVSGETNDNVELSVSGDGFRYRRQTTIGRDTVTSGALSIAGWFSPIGLTSAPLQGAALLNDLDLLYNGSFSKIPKSLPIQDIDIDIDW